MPSQGADDETSRDYNAKEKNAAADTNEEEGKPKHAASRKHGQFVFRLCSAVLYTVSSCPSV